VSVEVANSITVAYMHFSFVLGMDMKDLEFSKFKFVDVGVEISQDKLYVIP